MAWSLVDLPGMCAAFLTSIKIEIPFPMDHRADTSE
jgi:hypothetical protein